MWVGSLEVRAPWLATTKAWQCTLCTMKPAQVSLASLHPYLSAPPTWTHLQSHHALAVGRQEDAGVASRGGPCHICGQVPWRGGHQRQHAPPRQAVQPDCGRGARGVGGRCGGGKKLAGGGQARQPEGQATSAHTRNTCTAAGTDPAAHPSRHICPVSSGAPICCVPEEPPTARWKSV